MIYLFISIILISIVIYYSILQEWAIFKNSYKVETKNTYGYSNFITNKERKILIKFIEKNLSKFEQRSNEKELLVTLEDLPNYPKSIINKLRKRIIKKESIGKHYPDLNHQSAVSIIYDGGFHDYHRDINYLNWILVRYNIILSKPSKGGLSVYADEINDWEENSIWKCVAGLHNHGVTMVRGDKPRIVLCLGFMIPMDDVMKKENNLKVKNFQNLPDGLEYLNRLD